MARRRKGRPLTGWLVVDKPAGLTSTALVNTARRLLDAQKAGHCGTLDPSATGLLAIAFGEATKAVPHITDALKAYRFTVAWGAATNTDDAEGEVIATAAERPTETEIRAALPAFTGEIMQVPPRFSAVRIDGQRAYALARAGEEPELAARPLWVESLELVEMPDADSAVFEMVCGKGGYVRAIARDLGAALGCLGHVTALRRLWSGPFTLAEHGFAWPPDGPDAAAVEAALLPLEAGLAELPEARVDMAGAARLRHGNPAGVLYTEAETGETAWASDPAGTAIALGTYKYGQLHPNRVFNLQTG